VLYALKKGNCNKMSHLGRLFGLKSKREISTLASFLEMLLVSSLSKGKS